MQTDRAPSGGQKSPAPTNRELSRTLPVIDLTELADSDNSVDDDDEPSNSAGFEGRPTMCKIVFRKVIKTSRLKICRDTRAEHIHVSLFSKESKSHLKELHGSAKRTYVGSSLNPFLGQALFAAEDISAGDFICLYPGRRMSYKECDALQRCGRPGNFALSLPGGIVIDALGYPHGAAMANHSCVPNTRLNDGVLRGWEHAQIGRAHV